MSKENDITQEEQQLELIESWINGNCFTVLKTIENKEDLAQLTLAFLEHTSIEETKLFLEYIIRQ